jgi:hypothetical protein
MLMLPVRSSTAPYVITAPGSGSEHAPEKSKADSVMNRKVVDIVQWTPVLVSKQGLEMLFQLQIVTRADVRKVKTSIPWLDSIPGGDISC